jgi:hypothetical protein
MALIYLVLELILIITVATYWVGLYHNPDVQKKRSRFVLAAFLLAAISYVAAQTYLISKELADGYRDLSKVGVFFVACYVSYRLTLLLPERLRKYACIALIALSLWPALLQLNHIYYVLTYDGPDCARAMRAYFVEDFWNVIFPC